MQNDMPLYWVIDLCLSGSVLSSRLVEQETQTLPQRSNDPAKNRTGPALYHSFVLLQHVLAFAHCFTSINSVLAVEF